MAISNRISTRRALLRLLQLAAVILGALHTWAAATRHAMNADGIAYLDLGDAWWRGDWTTAINSVWSPLYPWLLGMIMRLFQPGPQWEFPLVHLVNFVIYLLAFAAFHLFWLELWLHQQERHRDPTWPSGRVGLPGWAWQAIGYTLFIWTSHTLIKLWAVTPDMLMSALVYIAATLLVRIRRGYDGWRIFIALGLCLGLAYLAKAAMFPLGLLFLAVSLFASGQPRHIWPRLLAGLLFFLLLTIPYATALSLSRGRPTISDAGTITYLRYAQGLPYPHWQGDGSPLNGTPIHPTRRVHTEPPVYEFAAPVGGTYAVSTDPIYWYEGARPRFDVVAQLNLLLASFLFYLDLFVRLQGVLLAAVLLLYLKYPPRPISWSALPRRWGLSLIALAAFALFASIYVEGRYVAVFVVLFWADLLANLRLPGTALSRELASLLSLIVIGFFILSVAVFNLQGLVALRSEPAPADATSRPGPAWPGETAAALQQLGIGPGDHVGVIGYAFDSYWARLARVRIVAEMLEWDADTFWFGSATTRQDVLRAFATTGARAIVAEYVPRQADTNGWRQVGVSSYYIYLLPAETP